MIGLITLLSIVAAIVMLFRHLRKREMEAFKEADMSVFEHLKTGSDKKRLDPLAAKANKGTAADASKSNLIRLPASETSQPIAPIYELKKALFDEVHRLFYENLESAATGKYRIFVSVPLQEFVRVDRQKTGEQILRGKRVSFLLCHKKAMTIACGIQLRGAGLEYGRHFDFLVELFRQIEKPLLDFPLINNISEQEIREKLDTVTAESPLTRSCPKCGRDMMMRKAVKGKNAGKTFWVCAEFPSCNGITRIGRFP